MEPGKAFAQAPSARSMPLPAYTLRHFIRSADDGEVTDDTRDIEAVDDDDAVRIAQAVVAEPQQDLLGIELTNADERLVWSLKRGDMTS